MYYWFFFSYKLQTTKFFTIKGTDVSCLFFPVCLSQVFSLGSYFLSLTLDIVQDKLSEHLSYLRTVSTTSPWPISFFFGIFRYIYVLRWKMIKLLLGEEITFIGFDFYKSLAHRNSFLGHHNSMLLLFLVITIRYLLGRCDDTTKISLRVYFLTTDRR